MKLLNESCKQREMQEMAKIKDREQKLSKRVFEVEKLEIQLKNKIDELIVLRNKA